ncbi:NAD kinase [Propionivibrio dicarboxylicus]|uniref:NAD kinase n=1 Tax=Propionivibrio dicarboxylicus TaxID=83767 RepID=A0A1G7XLE8_9RHOO|nr:NAD kinase [Propionivibrio dicarboxylicus]SDG85002.1 NAD+ kinase [Propionivibrio dicarboxylicus]
MEEAHPTHYRFDPKTVALIGKYQSREISESLSLLARELERRGLTVIVEKSTADSASSPEFDRWERCDFAGIGQRADVAIVLGGDGTMLNAARQLAHYCVPLVGVNQGRLGFMTDIARSDMLAAMDDLLAGKFKPETRLLLEAEVFRGGEKVASSLALNEVVVDKGPIGRLIEFQLYIDNEFVFTLRSDGLIVSTPTGSTAYALSANGPIQHPQVSGIALVPLCPHSLTNRPILVSDRNEIEIRIRQAIDSRAHFDGQVTFDLRTEDVVRIRRSKFSICLLHPPGYSYFAMLREKLHWSELPQILKHGDQGDD